MKYNQSPPSFKTRVISTDGSSISIEFPYPKKELFLMNDLKNIPLYLSQKKKDSDSKKRKTSSSFTNREPSVDTKETARTDSH